MNRQMDGLSSSLAVLTAMITPAVLISASGTMILSTSTRLGRVVDRVRSLSDRFQQLAFGLRSAPGAEHHARRNGFHLADDQALRAEGAGRATQDTLRALQKKA